LGQTNVVDSFATPSSLNASPNQAFAGTLQATLARDQHVLIWSPNLLPSNLGFQQQAVSTANDGWNNEWNSNVSFAPPALDPASQFAQSLSYATPGFGQNFIPALSSADYPVYSNTIANGQLDPTVQFPDFGVYNDFGAYNAFGIYNHFNAMPDPLANPTPFTQWEMDDLTAIDPQETMGSFNPLLPPTTTSMPAAPALPTHATNMLTVPTAPRPIARTAISRRSTAGTNAYTCGYAGCGRIFTRGGDLARHTQQHGVPQHPCLIHRCNRRAANAFYRADKLRDHQRRKHGITT
jgi:hypothetical protein